MSKYLELVNDSFERIHYVKQKSQTPYVAYSIEDDKVIYTNLKLFYIESLEDNNVITLDSTTWIGYGDNKSKLEYSSNTDYWIPMNSVNSITINKGEKLYIRCIKDNICKYLAPDGSMSEEDLISIMMTPLFKTSTNCNIGGDINTVMFDYTYNTEECVLTTGAFTGLFVGADMMTGESTNYIIDASKLELPATTLADICYYGMFAYCASLVTIPELPATTLAEGCYSSMFQNCTSLVIAPELPATTLVYGCYNYMFQGCTSLTAAPKLPATMLAENCYEGMFYSCTSLTAAPELPAVVLAGGCYNWMFYGCKSLITAPELPAMALADSCYYSMFRGCKSLTTAPELPATTLADYCYQGMFEDCTSLVTAPELPATTLTKNCYAHMFHDCTSLVTAPELPATTLAEYCYTHIFANCTSLNYIKCLATDISDISAYDCTYAWVNNVSRTGTFYKHPDMNDWTTGDDGIPYDWTVENAVL